MQAILLAGGFAKRLWPLTKETPKPLLPVGGRPIIEHILEKLSDIKELEKVYVSVNQKFEPSFLEWARSFRFGKEIEIVTEPSMSERDKLGAIGALGFLLKEKGISDDLLVVAGDNLFDFDINRFISGREDGTPVVALYNMPDKESVRKRYGVVVLDEDNTIREFHEKPEQPVSTLVSTGCYFFPKKAVEMIHEYLNDGNNPDAPGFFVSWLAQQMAVQGFVFDGNSKWFDIGNLDSYKEAMRMFKDGKR